MHYAGQISAIAFDIDGTLLNSQGRLSEPDCAAIRKCAEQGILLCVATARPKRLTFRPCEVPADAAFLSDRGVFYNGAELLDAVPGYAKHWLMDPETTRRVTDLLSRAAPDIQIAIQIREEYHSYRLPMTDTDMAVWGFAPHELLPFAEACEQECSKIVAYHPSVALGETHERLQSELGASTNAFLTDSAHWIQVVSGQASKTNAFLHLLDRYGIPREQAAVFGDDVPDLDMFRAFPCSVAMANASQELKESATFVTRSNDDSGVAYALERLLHLV
ncbi:MAG: HAD-IIB family hydrolase [Candidatus Hydrogenedentes bacterium]|nr:HAD-IIB family hydrolase [Candidatus Hydrogenedentota bacterium]